MLAHQITQALGDDVNAADLLKATDQEWSFARALYSRNEVSHSAVATGEVATVAYEVMEAGAGEGRAGTNSSQLGCQPC